MEIITTSKKHTHGNNIFHVEVLYPGEALGRIDTGFYTIGRIDHANFRPPGIVPMHPHRDDEIFSYMRTGIMVHKDSAGHREHLDAANMMLMNAGSGMYHEESAEKEVEMLQIFMRPSKNGLEPKVQFHHFENIYSESQWRLVAGNSEPAPLQLRTDTNIFDVRLYEGSSLQAPTPSCENVINVLYCFNGQVTVGDQKLTKGEVLIYRKEQVSITAGTTSDLVLFQINEEATYSETGMFSGNSINAKN